MNPAYSVIFFTVASGAGYGLVVWLAAAWLGGFNPDEHTAGTLGTVFALVLISAGLLSSTLHLGHPERSWRAMSQWRTSWLSREGVLALITYVPMSIFALGWFFTGQHVGMVRLAAVLCLVLCPATVFATGKIYASLKPIPRWNNRWVVPVYLITSLASGALLFAWFKALDGSGGAERGIAMAFVTFAWLAKIGYWRSIDRNITTSTAATATGLTKDGSVTQMEGPHTAENFVMREMGYEIGRKHSKKLRRIALWFGAIIPVLMIVFASMLSGWFYTLVITIAVVSGLTGLVVERWLFFAEAKHAVTLYYGQPQV